MPGDLDELLIRPIGVIEALQPVIGRGKPKPCFGIVVPLLDGLAVKPLGQAVIAVAIVILGLLQPDLFGPRAERRGIGDVARQLFLGAAIAPGSDLQPVNARAIAPTAINP